MKIPSGNVTISLEEYHRFLDLEKSYDAGISFNDGCNDKFYGNPAKYKIVHKTYEMLKKLNRLKRSTYNLSYTTNYAINTCPIFKHKGKDYILRNDIRNSLEKVINDMNRNV